MTESTDYDRKRDELEKEALERARSRGRYLDKMTPEEQMANASVDVSVMSALFDSEFWKTDVWPRIKEAHGVVSDPEFWKEDVKRNIKPALKKSAQSATAGVLGAPMDMSIIAAHTLWWVSDNIGLSNRGHHDWLNDMPDFSQFPTSSDSLMKTLFDEEPEGIEWIAGNLLSPDPAFIAKASVFIGPVVGFPRYIASLGNDTAQVRNAFKNYEDAKYYKDLVLKGEMTQSEMIAETGWAVSPNGELQMFLDSSDASFDWNKIDEALLSAANSAKADATHTVATVRTGDMWDHPQLRQVYGDEYGAFSTEFSLERIPKGQTMQGLGGYQITDAKGDRWQVSGNRGKDYGAAMESELQWEKSKARITGANARDYPGQKPKDRAALRSILEEYMVHEYRHAFSALEGFVGGGNSKFYESLIRNNIEGYLANQIPLLVEQAARAGIDVASDLQFFKKMVKDFPNVNEDRLRRYIQRGALMAQDSDDADFLRQSNIEFRNSYERELTKIVNMTAGTKVSKEAVDMFARRMDNVVIYDLSRNIYGRLGDEQAARMQEYLWTMRERDPEKRMELAKRYALDQSWNFRDLPPYIERLFGPDYDPKAPVKGLTQSWNPETRTFELSTEGKKWETYMKGAPERAPADQADELGIALVDDGVVTLTDFKEAPKRDQLEMDFSSGLTGEALDTLRKDKRLTDIEFERQYNGDPSIVPGTAKHDKILKGLNSEEELLDDLEGGLGIDRADAEKYLDDVLKERMK